MGPCSRRTGPGPPTPHPSLPSLQSSGGEVRSGKVGVPTPPLRVPYTQTRLKIIDFSWSFQLLAPPPPQSCVTDRICSGQYSRWLSLPDLTGRVGVLHDLPDVWVHTSGAIRHNGFDPGPEVPRRSGTGEVYPVSSLVGSFLYANSCSPVMSVKGE